MGLNILCGLFLIFFVGEIKAQSNCTNLGSYYIYVKEGNDTKYYIVPNMETKGAGKELTTTSDVQKRIKWNCNKCGREYIIKYIEDKKLVWDLKTGCKGSQVIIYPKSTYSENNRFTIFPAKVCDKCLYRAENGNIMASEKCDDKKTIFYINIL